MGSSVWEELLGSYSRCVRGALLLSADGRVLKSTLPKDDEFELNTQWIAMILSSQSHQIDIKTDTGWILSAPLNTQQVLVVVIEAAPHIRFNLDLIRLFAEDDTSGGDSRLLDPTIVPKPPKRDGAHAVPEYDD